MLTEQQLKFCKNIALYEMSPIEAFINAGYESKTNSRIPKRVQILLSNKAISDEIDRLRCKYLDLDEVRKDIILEHHKTRDLDIASIVYPVPYVDKDGVKRFRLEIKPVAEWTLEQRRALVGYDKNGIPQFRNKEQASKELARLFGLYKDNTVVVEQDLDSIYADAKGESNDDEIDELVVDMPDEVINDEMETLDAVIMQMGEEAAEEDEEKHYEKKEPDKAKADKLKKLLDL